MPISADMRLNQRGRHPSIDSFAEIKKTLTADEPSCDITDLERERALFKTLIATIPDPVWVKDPNGVYLACNMRLNNSYGTSAAAIIGRTDDDFVAVELAVASAPVTGMP